MPIDYSLYHPEWKTKIRPRILNRARHKCEFCGIPDRAKGYRDISGEFHQIYPDPDPDLIQQPGEKIITIVLTVAHLNHNIEDNRDENLKALCQRCHIHYDKDHHAETRRRKQTQMEQECRERLTL